MKKSDVILIITILIISSLIMLIWFKKKEGNKAIVYYDSKAILQLDLKQNGIYEVEGAKGKVKIEVNSHGVRVVAENSPYHICSRQGYIKKSYETIVCLPNKIVIKIANEEIDTVVR